MRVAATQSPSKPRSSQVRERRSQDTLKKSEKKAVRTPMMTATTLPITMRSSVMGLPLTKQNSARPPRHFSIPVSIPGVELVVPKLPKIQFGWRLLSGFLTAALLAAVIFATSTPFFQVSNLEITGLQRIKPADLASSLHLEYTPIFAVDPLEVEKIIASGFPELKNLQVSIELPAKINITVIERQPIVAWKYKDLTTWIDSDGYSFPARGTAAQLLTIKADSTPPMKSVLPMTEEKTITSSNSTAEKTDQKIVDLTLIQAAITLKDKVKGKSSLIYSNNNGLGWVDPGGWRVFVGQRLDNLEQKLVVYAAIVKKLKADGIEPKLVSVQNPNAPYYRVEN